MQVDVQCAGIELLLSNSLELFLQKTNGMSIVRITNLVHHMQKDLEGGQRKTELGERKRLKGVKSQKKCISACCHSGAIPKTHVSNQSIKQLHLKLMQAKAKAKCKVKDELCFRSLLI